jgi:hypothetical protein
MELKSVLEVLKEKFLVKGEKYNPFPQKVKWNVPKFI